MAESILHSGALASSGGAVPFATGRRKIALIAGILALLAASITMVALSDGTGGTAVQKARDFFGLVKDRSLADGTVGTLVEKGRDFLALMKARSPGERTAAELIKSKKARAAAFVPRQRALAKIQKPAIPKEFLEALAPPVLPQVAELVPGIIAPANVVPAEIIPPSGPGGPVIFPPGGPVVFPPVGTPPTVVTPPTLPPQVPPVPEPSTWASMLLGFGLLGFVCRSRRRRAAAQA